MAMGSRRIDSPGRGGILAEKWPLVECTGSGGVMPASLR